jgi:short-subunit dehydrogenase involved in D-alanine esterification of teichoic acids
VERPVDISNFYFPKVDQEIDINIRGPMHLAIGLVEHFKSKPLATIVNVSSVLGYTPTSIINPVYNGSKAWLHFWTMTLRTQLSESSDGKNVEAIEIAPPTVATDLHGNRHRQAPDDNKKDKNPNALDVSEFMGFMRKGL